MFDHNIPKVIVKIEISFSMKLEIDTDFIGHFAKIFLLLLQQNVPMFVDSSIVSTVEEWFL